MEQTKITERTEITEKTEITERTEIAEITEETEISERTESLEFIGNMKQEDEAEQQRSLQRRQRIEEMKRQKRKTEIIHRWVKRAAAMALAAVCVGVCSLICFRIVEKSRSSDEYAQQDQSDREEPEEGKQDGTEEFVSNLTGILQGGDFSELQNIMESMTTMISGGGKPSTEETDTVDGGGSAGGGIQSEELQPTVFEAFSTSVTDGFWEDIVSEYGVLVDVESQTILAARDCQSRINPASMTKILTVLVAAEKLGITDGTEAVLDDTFTMTIEITDYCYVNDCSAAGFSVDEEISVRDLFYGTILPSGADAAVGLATYTSGSHEAFVELMNGKLEELELSDSTHFTNCVGLYDEDHYSTVYDIAVILKEAADNPFLREVLSAHTHNTALTEQHPEGILLSNWFLRRIEDRDTHGEVLCGKTGFVTQSGSCAASLSVDMYGREYLCVTAGSSSSWKCINDQTMLYEKYLPAE